MNGLILLRLLAALSGAMAVSAGAYGAHGATGEGAEWLKTGAHYQLAHAVAALVAFGLFRSMVPAWLFVVGAAIFSGTLYMMAFGAPRWFGAITPIGGLLLIVGWIWLGVAPLFARG